MTPKDKLVCGYQFLHKHSGHIYSVVQAHGYDTQVYYQLENGLAHYGLLPNYLLLDDEHYEPLDYELDPL